MDIEDLLSSVSPEELERLKNIASSIIAETPPKNDGKQSDNTNNIIPSMESLKPIMSAISKCSVEDDRIKLITHLKPLLGTERQKKADEAIKFLHIMQILPEIRGLI